MATRTLASEVSAIEAFRGLEEEALDEIAALGLRRPIPARQLVFSQGESAGRFHALLSGWMRISQIGPEGEQALIRLIGPGEIFGSFAVFVDGTYPGDAIAMVDSVELSWTADQLRRLIELYPPIALNLVALAGRRLAELQERVREISTQPAQSCIANTLLRLARNNGQSRDDGGVELPLPLVRRDIAGLSGTTLHTASRVLAAWERKGIVASGRRRLSIASLDALRRIGAGG